MSDQRAEDVEDMRSTSDYGNTSESSKWVDLFVHEMMNARDIDDARGRAARILEAFEQSITAPSMASEEVISMRFCNLSLSQQEHQNGYAPQTTRCLSYVYLPPCYCLHWGSWNMLL